MVCNNSNASSLHALLSVSERRQSLRVMQVAYTYKVICTNWTEFYLTQGSHNCLNMENDKTKAHIVWNFMLEPVKWFGMG